MKVSFTGILALSASAAAQVAQQCFGDICYQINIPESTASSGTGDIFLQIKAPTTYSWVAVGQGSGMDGANIFVAYTSGDGSNVTVSPRLGTGYIMPRHNADAQITMLEGTGVSNGEMTANFKCSSCNSWTGGSMNFQENSASWIHAAYLGQALNSDDPSAAIRQHNQEHEAYNWNVATAKGGSSLNPFADPTVSTPPPGTSTGEVSGPPFSMAMLIFFPLGAISVRVFNFSGLVWFHAGIQMLALALFTASVGLGIVIALKLNYLDGHYYHPVIGLVVFALMWIQPIGGFLHHLGFKKHGGRTIISHAHIWIGRIAITLGMINGGFGLGLADNSKPGEIAYGVIAGVVFVVWVAASLYGEMKRERAPVKYDQSSGPNANEYYASQEAEKASS